MPLPMLKNQSLPNLSTTTAYTGGAPTSREQPKSFTQMYQDTFTNPLGNWNEYNQGQGAQFTEQAARGMAKTGRTGMLPTLQTMAHQDYMSNYLPSIRESLVPGLQSDTTKWTTQLQSDTDRYGTDRQYDANIYNTDTVAQTALEQMETDKYMKELDNLTRTYDIDETTKRQIYNTFSGIYGDLTNQQRDSVLAELGIVLGQNTAGNNAVADVTTGGGDNPMTPWVETNY